MDSYPANMAKAYAKGTAANASHRGRNNSRKKSAIMNVSGLVA